jgi:hypothetical protein
MTEVGTIFYFGHRFFPGNYYRYYDRTNFTSNYVAGPGYSFKMFEKPAWAPTTELFVLGNSNTIFMMTVSSGNVGIAQAPSVATYGDF